MLRKIIRILALLAVIAFAVGVTLSKGVYAIFQHQHSASQATAPAAEHKVAFWYDAMNPQHHYQKPGKAPDGMDLVPQYADENGTIPMDAASTPGSERKIVYWYDPMHPAYKADKPGTAPDCGMQLVPKYADDEATKMPTGTVKIEREKAQLIGMRTEIADRQSLMRSVHTTGQVTSDETRLAHVHVKTSGYLDKVYVDYIGQLVRKGQPLFTIYSPDLLATEEEYLIAKRGANALGTSQFAEISQGSQSLLRSTRERLKLWDMSDDQIKRLDETGEVTKTLTFYSPTSGFVTDRKAFPQTAVTPDMDLYVISDLSRIWVNADVYEYEVPFVKVGQTADVQLSYYAGKTYRGKITYIYPTVDPVSHTVKVRIELPNRNFELKPQMIANVELKINYGKQILVSQEAVMDSGDKQYVFVVHDGAVFEPRVIQMGAKVDGKVVVLSGLNEGESVVASGNFLVDSESRLKGAMSGMQH